MKVCKNFVNLHELLYDYDTLYYTLCDIDWHLVSVSMLPLGFIDKYWNSLEMDFVIYRIYCKDFIQTHWFRFSKRQRDILLLRVKLDIDFIISNNIYIPYKCWIYKSLEEKKILVRNILGLSDFFTLDYIQCITYQSDQISTVYLSDVQNLGSNIIRLDIGKILSVHYDNSELNGGSRVSFWCSGVSFD